MGLEERKAILKELRTPDRLRENLDVVDIVLGFLSSGGAKAEKPLGDYIDKVLKMEQRSFSMQVSTLTMSTQNIRNAGSQANGRNDLRTFLGSYMFSSTHYLSLENSLCRAI